MKTVYLLLLAVVMSTVACRTEQGDPGPAGESGLNQQGSISGKLEYVDYNGKSISVPFEYAYYESLSDNKFYYDENGKKNYQMEFFRRDLKDNHNYMTFSNLYGFNTNNTFNAPSGGTFDFSLVKIIDNNLFEFNGAFSSGSQTSSYSITNYIFNENTGRLIFEFELTFAPSDIDFSTRYDNTETATVKGRVDVILNRTQSYSVVVVPVPA